MTNPDISSEIEAPPVDSDPLSRPAPSCPPMLRRKKVRRGTSSCWECRHRKVRCAFAAGAIVCTPCQRRGSECVGQQFEVDHPVGSKRPSADYRAASQRLVQVETLVNSLLQPAASISNIQRQQPRILRPKAIRNPRPSSASIRESAPASGVEDASRKTKPGRSSACVSNTRAKHSTHMRTLHFVTEPSIPPAMSEYYHISHHLLSIMPSLGSALGIIRGARCADLPIQMLHKPYADFISSQGKSQAQTSFDVPEPTAHPILIARRLLQIAVSLQLLEEDTSHTTTQASSRRYFEAATHHVTSKDHLVSSHEGLEALMLEGLYQINTGSMRLGWLTFRRAIGIAQVLRLPLQGRELPQLTKQGEATPSFQWFRLNYSDRCLSLLMGLPPAALDDNFATSDLLAADVPVGRLERLHTVAMGRLICRNQRIAAAESISQALRAEMNTTQELDQELYRISTQFPRQWWPSPHLSSLAPEEADSMGETARLLAQVNQAHLLLILHLPYTIQVFLSRPEPDYAYSLHNSIKASRDLLSRFVLYRRFNRIPSCCRAVDFKAFTASVCLLLAHLDGHRLGPGNTLRHHRLEDLGLIEQAVSDIQELAKRSPISQGETEVRVLRALLDAESDAANGSLHSIQVYGHGFKGECEVLELEGGFEFGAPFFGKVRVQQLAARTAAIEQPPLGPSDSFRDICSISTSTSGEEFGAWLSPPEEVAFVPQTRLEVVDVQNGCLGSNGWVYPGYEAALEM